MRIVDYETARTLNDVCLILSQVEVQELSTYLAQLIKNPSVHRVYLSELDGNSIGRELTVELQTPSICSGLNPAATPA